MFFETADLYDRITVANDPRLGEMVAMNSFCCTDVACVCTDVACNVRTNCGGGGCRDVVFRRDVACNVPTAVMD